MNLKAVSKVLAVAIYFAWSDTKARYRRSVLGPFWIVLGTAIGVAGLGVLWSALLQIEKSVFIPSLTIGLVTWQLIAGCVTESPTVFVRNASIIRNINTSKLLFPLQLLFRHLINFAHNLVVVLAVLIVYPPQFSLVQLLAIPGLVILSLNLLWIVLLIGVLGARLRDLEQLIAAVMPMLFFLTPVIYRTDALGAHMGIVWANPFTYLISVVRDPIQGIAPGVSVYLVSIGLLLVGGSAALAAYRKRQMRIAFWV